MIEIPAAQATQTKVSIEFGGIEDRLGRIADQLDLGEENTVVTRCTI